MANADLGSSKETMQAHAQVSLATNVLLSSASGTASILEALENVKTRTRVLVDELKIKAEESRSMRQMLRDLDRMGMHDGVEEDAPSPSVSVPVPVSGDGSLTGIIQNCIELNETHQMALLKAVDDLRRSDYTAFGAALDVFLRDVDDGESEPDVNVNMDILHEIQQARKAVGVLRNAAVRANIRERLQATTAPGTASPSTPSTPTTPTRNRSHSHTSHSHHQQHVPKVLKEEYEKELGRRERQLDELHGRMRAVETQNEEYKVELSTLKRKLWDERRNFQSEMHDLQQQLAERDHVIAEFKSQIQE